jgi:hypothetical protein
MNISDIRSKRYLNNDDENDTSGDEERLRIVKMDTANGTIVFVEFVDESSHTVIP